MLAAEFATLYPESIPEQRWRQDSYSPLLRPGRQWSNRFGMILQAGLREGGFNDSGLDETLGAYAEWGQYAIPNVQDRLSAEPDSPEKFRAIRELGFHVLNASMLQLWQLPAERPSEQAHRQLTVFSKHVLAHAGMRTLVSRQRSADNSQDYAYFSAANEDRRATIEGQLNEYDTAIILLNAFRKRSGISVLPAPMQFENGPRRSRNVDFVIWDREGEGYAVGVQTKAAVRNRHSDTYDPRAVVLVSGQEDLASVRATRTRVKSSETRVVTWAGQVCAHTIASMKTHGEQSELANVFSQQFGSRGRTEALNRKVLARQLLGGAKPRIWEATAVVADRVAAKLYATTGQQETAS